MNNFGAKIQILEDDTIRRNVRARLLVTKDDESSRAAAKQKHATKTEDKQATLCPSKRVLSLGGCRPKAK